MKLLNLLLMIVMFSLPCYSQQYLLEAKYNAVENDYNFWVCTPPNYIAKDSTQKVDPSTNTSDSITNSNPDTTLTCLSKEKYPLVVFLHGASLCGHDLNRVRRYGCLHAIKMGRDINAVILAPQNPGGAWNPHKLLKLMNYMSDNYDIDTNRIYVLGMSLGGYGTIDFCATYPEKIAAAMALCGGHSGMGTVKNLGKLPLWIIHGTKDRAVPISCSKNVVAQLEEQQNDSLLMYTWLPGGSHGAPAKLFYMPKTYEWLFSHSLRDSIRTINRSFTVSMSDLPHAYEGITKTVDRIKVTGYIAPVYSSQNRSYDNSYSGPMVDYEKCQVHVVKSGDVLVNLAKRYHVTVDQICRLNHISRNSMLHIGQKLRIREK
jgi:pimeloyl-ACP methyl ester carboxylesterase